MLALYVSLFLKNLISDSMKTQNKNFFLASAVLALGCMFFTTQSAYAGAALPEGVYDMPDGSRIIVDLTAPTGSISVTADGGTAVSVDGLFYKKYNENLILGMTHQDNFQEYGSFKSWTIMGRSGANAAGVCNFSGGYITPIATGTNYTPSPETVEDGVLAQDLPSTCYQYQLQLEDQSGNTSQYESEVVFAGGYMDETKTSVSFGTGCNTWIADAKNTCEVTFDIRDISNLPLKNFRVNVKGFSDTSYDQIHFPTRDDAHEAVYFDGAITAISTGLDFTTDGNGQLVLQFVSYAPTMTSDQKLDFTLSDIDHPTNPQISKQNNAYEIFPILGETWVNPITFFQKNATQNLAMTLTNRIGTALASNIKMGLYIAHSSSAFTIFSSLLPGEAKTTWLLAGGNTGAISSLGLDPADINDRVFYVSADDTTASTNYDIRFSKNPGTQDFTGTVKLAFFARMTLNGKEVAYSLDDGSNTLNKTVPFYNQASEVQGSGLTQSSAGQASQLSGTDAAKESTGSISLQQITTQLKETIKKEILNLPADTSSQTRATARKINNGRTYVVKGDGKDLVIDEETLSIGAEPMAFVTYGGNIIIRSNISYSGSIKPTIAFIALRNESSGAGGEIHIMNETSTGTALTHLTGAFFAERGVLGAENTNSVDLTAEARQAALTHQLVIEGSVMGGNTLGGGDDPYACPSFIRTSVCDEMNAQKYDLNYLRRYIPGVGTPANPSSASDKPVIIEYFMNKELLPSELLLK